MCLPISVMLWPLTPPPLPPFPRAQPARCSFLYAAVDMRVFKDNRGKFGAVNFWRCLPHEDGRETPHLSDAPR